MQIAPRELLCLDNTASSLLNCFTNYKVCASTTGSIVLCIVIDLRINRNGADRIALNYPESAH